VGYVHVDAQQHVLEAFCSVVHEAQLEALLVEEALGKGPPEGVGGKAVSLENWSCENSS
jgi:hypothetical protein